MTSMKFIINNSRPTRLEQSNNVVIIDVRAVKIRRTPKIILGLLDNLESLLSVFLNI